MHRFYVERRLVGGEVELPAHVARQVSTVLRMKEGDRLTLFDGTGPEWEAQLIGGGKAARVRLVQERPASPPAARRVTLCQAMLKAERMELVLQKATELGIAIIQPLLTEHVVARKEQVPERWRRIVIEAAEQSGRTTLPELREPVRLADVLETGSESLFCWENERDRTLWSSLAAGAPKALNLIIGPEGGFSAREAEQARAAGAVSVSLGHQILRAETAAIAASTLVLLAP